MSDIAEPFKELIDPLIADIVRRKKIFNEEYDDSETYRDLRWETVLEGIFVSQLDRISHTFTAEQIGEYVIEFFNSRNEGKFDI